LSEAKKNPSHQSDWDQTYSWLPSFKHEDVSLHEQFLQAELRFSFRRLSAPHSRARTCDHLIMSQVSNSYNSPSSNHNVNICKIKGYELSASIPAIAQAMYGIYRTAKYDSESSPISYT